MKYEGSERDIVLRRPETHTEEVAIPQGLHGVQAQGEKGCDVFKEVRALGGERMWGSRGCLGTQDVLLMRA